MLICTLFYRPPQPLAVAARMSVATAYRRGAYALAVNYRVGDANAAAAAAGRPSLRVFAHELEEAAAFACLLLLCKL